MLVDWKRLHKVNERESSSHLQIIYDFYFYAKVSTIHDEMWSASPQFSKSWAKYACYVCLQGICVKRNAFKLFSVTNSM